MVSVKTLIARKPGLGECSLALGRLQSPGSSKSHTSGSLSTSAFFFFLNIDFPFFSFPSREGKWQPLNFFVYSSVSVIYRDQLAVF